MKDGVRLNLADSEKCQAVLSDSLSLIWQAKGILGDIDDDDGIACLTDGIINDIGTIRVFLRGYIRCYKEMETVAK